MANILKESAIKLWDYLTTANHWYIGNGVPTPGSEIVGDNYIDLTSEYTNGDLSYEYYYKTSDTTWTLKGPLRAPNVSIQWSPTSTPGDFHDDYANGDLFIRFSNDGGDNWTIPVRVIGFFSYFAYANDDSGAGFTNTFDPLKAYIARTDFTYPHPPVVGDFVGKWVRYLAPDVIQEWSADGISGWTTTYANGLNYTRFSYDGGTSYTDAIKLIDGYIYAAYASNLAGDNFIGTDDPAFDPEAALALDYIAIKKFDESHNGDLTASDYTDYFRKYKGSAISAYSTISSLSIPTDKDGNNPEYPILAAMPRIHVYDSGIDVTTLWTVNITTAVGVDAVVDSGNIIDISNITADEAYVNITCTRTDYSDTYITIFVHKTPAGQAVVDATSVDDSTIEFDVPTQKIRNKDAGITGAKLNPNVADDVTIEQTGTTLNVKDDGITTAKILDANVTTAKILDANITTAKILDANITTGKLAPDAVDNTKLADDAVQTENILDETINIDKLNPNIVDDISIFIDEEYHIKGNSLAHGATTAVSIGILSTTRIALVGANGSLEAYDFDGVDWTIQGNTLNIAADTPFSLCALSSTRIVVYGFTSDVFKAYDFDGTDWTLTGTSATINTSDSLQITTLTSTTFACINPSNNRLQTYSFIGTVFATVGNHLAITNSGPSISTLSSTSIVIYTGGNFRKYNFDGTDWTTDGNTFAASTIANGILGLTSSTIVIYNVTTDYLENYEFDGVDWNAINTPYMYGDGASSLDMAVLNYPQIVIADIAPGDSVIQTYYFGDKTLAVKDDGVTTVRIADDAITTAKILNANVTTAKIADANITTVKILDANITTAKILDANVTTDKIADLNITTGKLADEAIKGIKAGNLNIFLGGDAGANVTSGVNSVFIGYETGLAITTTSGNVFIGHQAGKNETGSNKLFIDNQDRTSEALGRTNSLIYGEFNTTLLSQLVRINANLEVSGKVDLAFGRTPTGSLYGNITTDDIFDALNPFIPDNNDEILLTGGFYASTADIDYIVSKAERLSTTEINVYSLNIKTHILHTYVMADGGTASIIANIIW